MDYGQMLAKHAESGADMTIACLAVPLEEAKGFGVMSVDADYRITKFQEKPANPQPMPGASDHALASMGNYIFNTEFLFAQLTKDADQGSASSHDFGKDIIPSIIHSHKIMAYPFKGLSQEEGEEGTENKPYWRDVGTLDAFWEANIDLVSVKPELNLYDENWPILTYHRQLPSAKFVFQDHDEGREGKALDSIVSAGCIISGATAIRSLLFSNVRLHSYSVVEECVLLPEVDVGRHCHIRKAIIERGCKIPPDTKIGFDKEADKQYFRVTENGITLVTPSMLAKRAQALGL
jgi:glucose-1-phosphate adenylyltransferase